MARRQRRCGHHCQERAQNLSIFILCDQIKEQMRRRSGVFIKTSLDCFSAEALLILMSTVLYQRSEDAAVSHPPSDDVHVDQQSSQLQIFIVAVLQRD